MHGHVAASNEAHMRQWMHPALRPPFAGWRACSRQRIGYATLRRLQSRPEFQRRRFQYHPKLQRSIGELNCLHSGRSAGTSNAKAVKCKACHCRRHRFSRYNVQIIFILVQCSRIFSPSQRIKIRDTGNAWLHFGGWAFDVRGNQTATECFQAFGARGSHTATMKCCQVPKSFTYCSVEHRASPPPHAEAKAHAACTVQWISAQMATQQHH